MFKKFLPKDEKFFFSLGKLSENVCKGALLLNEMLGNLHMLKEYSSQIHILENRCDDQTHEIINELNESFVTPIDREDIFSLANSLDDIIDAIDSIATRLSIYKFKGPFAFGPQLAQILVSQTELIEQVIKTLQDRKSSFAKIISIRNLETEGDSVFRDSLANLFETEKDPIELIMKKEILENIERAVDRCQKATLVMEAILIKNV